MNLRAHSVVDFPLSCTVQSCPDSGESGLAMPLAPFVRPGAVNVAFLLLLVRHLLLVAWHLFLVASCYY